MGIAVPSTFVSIGDLGSVKNALQVMYNYQVRDKSTANRARINCPPRTLQPELFQKLVLPYYNKDQTHIICGPWLGPTTTFSTAMTQHFCKKTGPNISWQWSLFTGKLGLVDFWMSLDYETGQDGRQEVTVVSLIWCRTTLFISHNIYWQSTQSVSNTAHRSGFVSMGRRYDRSKCYMACPGSFAQNRHQRVLLGSFLWRL